MSFFEPPRLIEADVFAAVPDRLRKGGSPSSWIDANHPGSKLDCFLEGPALDRDGHLYRVDPGFPSFPQFARSYQAAGRTLVDRLPSAPSG